MKRGALRIVAALAAVTGLVTSCGSVGVGILYFEPPHPSWSDRPQAAARTSTVEPGEGAYEFQLLPLGGATSQSACSIVVRRKGAQEIGRTQGIGSCTLSLTARRGDQWEVDARWDGQDPAEINLLADAPFPPQPFRRVAGAGALLLFVGAAAFIASLMLA